MFNSLKTSCIANSSLMNRASGSKPLDLFRWLGAYSLRTIPSPSDRNPQEFKRHRSRGGVPSLRRAARTLGNPPAQLSH
jgi:hypothetical protein